MTGRATETGPGRPFVEAVLVGNSEAEQLARDLETYHLFRHLAARRRDPEARERARRVRDAVRRMMRRKYAAGDYGEARRLRILPRLTVGDLAPGYRPTPVRIPNPRRT